LAKRLLHINSNAKIKYHNCFISSQNVAELVEGHHVAINALDFSSDIPFLFDSICLKANIPVLHPYNIGWAGLVTVLKPDSPQLSFISETYEGFEVKMAAYVTQNLRLRNTPAYWAEDVIQAYKDKIDEEKAPPQLSVASWIAAGFCTQIMFHLCLDRPVKTFPDFYFESVLNKNILLSILRYNCTVFFDFTSF